MASQLPYVPVDSNACHRVVIERLPCLTVSFINAMKAWLNASDRPGYYTIPINEVSALTQVTFYLSDADVAFEFRLRWS